MLLKYSLFQGHKMAFEAEMCVYWAPIPFKYIEFGFDKVKVHQLLDTCNKHPCSCIYTMLIHLVTLAKQTWKPLSL